MLKYCLVVVVSVLLLQVSITHAQTDACDKLGFITTQGEQMKLTTAIEYIVKGGAVLEAQYDAVTKVDSFHTFDQLFYFNPSRTQVTCSEDSVVFLEEEIVNNNNFYLKRMLIRFLDGTNTLESVTIETRKQMYPGLERWALRLRHVPFQPKDGWIALYDPIYPSTIAYLEYSLDKLLEKPKRLEFKHMTDSLDWIIGVRTTTAGVNNAAPTLSGVSCRYANGSLYTDLPDQVEATLVVSDILGRTIASRELHDKQSIHPLPLSVGRYFARVTIKGKTTSLPFLVQ